MLIHVSTSANLFRDLRQFGDAEEYDYIIKLVVIGDNGVGKTSLVYQYADHTFSESHITTLGIDYKRKIVDTNGKKCKLFIWDTAGQEQFRSITSTLYRGTHGVILVYDTQDICSFTNIPKWLQEVDKYCPDVPKILVGSKNDNPEEKEVPTRGARNFSKQEGIPLFEASAKKNTNVEQAFEKITQLAIKHSMEMLTKPQKTLPDVIRLNEQASGVTQDTPELRAKRVKNKKKCCK
ncbi:ras-related protein Rab-35-like [Watersipora subatra]|uniref:ras-related protein Rab-35-like n=1 Tax=Watersipora subatra TaxID=2589382 RepID=UPI00355B5D81